MSVTFEEEYGRGMEKGKLTRKGGGIKFVFNFDDVYQYEVL